MGVDKSEAQLHMAQENIHFAKCDNIHLIQGDAMGMSFLIIFENFLASQILFTQS